MTMLAWSSGPGQDEPPRIDPWTASFGPRAPSATHRWTGLTGDEATARGVDLAQSMEFFKIAAIPNRDVWVCTRCGEHGVMGAGGFMAEYGVMGDIEPGFV